MGLPWKITGPLPHKSDHPEFPPHETSVTWAQFTAKPKRKRAK